ncbi:MAG: hypothetical protein ACI3XG_00660 [Faecousia sp.]
MMKRLRDSIRKKCNDNATILGLFFGLAVLVILLPGILSAERLGTVDNGDYEPVLLSAGLEYLESDLEAPSTLCYNRVIEDYRYGSFSFWKLLAPNGENSVIYPIALIRLVTEPFGLNFSTVYLAVVYALLYAIGTYVLVRSCAYLTGWLAAFPGLFLAMAASSPNLAAYWNSLYPTGTVIVGLLLMTAMALRLFTYAKQKLTSGLLAFLAAATFCLNSSERSLIFAPFAVAVTAAALVRGFRNGRLRPASAVCAVVILLAAISSSSQYLHASTRNYSDASAYHAAFLGFLETSDDPAADLAEFGLDESYLPDVGNSYYLSADAYSHDPRDEKEAQALFAQLNADTIGTWYLRHPLRLLQTVNRLPEQFNHFESDAVLMVGQTNDSPTRVTRFWSITDTLMKMFLPENHSAAMVLLLLELAAALWLTISLIRQGEGKGFALLAGCSALAFAVGTFGYMLVHVRYLGRDGSSFARIVSVYGMLLGTGGVCMAAGDGICHLSAWFRAKQLAQAGPVDLSQWRLGLLGPGTQGSIGGGIPGRILDSRPATTGCIFLLALAMSCIVQFAPERAGCVNNGDFGRMMDQLGLIWQGDIFYNVSAQLGRRVVEEYAFREAFDWTSLTFLNPKYSLIYPASLVRLFCTLTGRDFSTWYLSLVMNAVLLACIVSIVYDLHALLGRYTILLGLGLCGVFLCESYLVWFNSLFGESCMFMGLFMVIACCVHLAVRPANKGWLWVLLLMFSGRILVCAKAQMLVALPFVLLLIIIFALYQRPLALKGLIPYTIAVMIGCAVICFECITVYNDNSGISERQTVWQATFYGALMVSDDPEAAMEELGIDTRMMPDIGKDAYQPDEDYVISPNSPEADAALYDQVNTFTMVKYYCRHPIQLLKMLNHAASASRTVYNDFRAYLGQDYTQEHDQVQRLGLWLYWRYFFTCGSFLGYVVLYGIAMGIAVCGVLRNSKTDIRWKMLAVVYLGVLLIGAVQYPLSVIGNGFADNHKQMFGFMMCHDFLVIFSLTILIRYLRMHGAQVMDRLRAGRRIGA